MDTARLMDTARFRAVRAAGALAAAHLALAAGLSGCSMPDGSGSIYVDPSRYSAYHCKDLAARAKELSAREQELRGLLDKAGESTGGRFVGTLAYQTDYETVQTEEKQVQRLAREKNCDPAQNFQSDSGIR